MFRKKIATWFEVAIIEVFPIPKKYSTSSFSVQWKRGSKGTGKTKENPVVDERVQFSEVLSFQGSIMQEKGGLAKEKFLEFSVLMIEKGKKAPIVIGVAQMDLAEIYYGKGESVMLDLLLHKSISIPLGRIKIRAMATDPKPEVLDKNIFTVVDDDMESLMNDTGGRFAPLSPRSPRSTPCSPRTPVDSHFLLENDQLQRRIKELEDELLAKEEKEHEKEKEKEKEKGTEDAVKERQAPKAEEQEEALSEAEEKLKAVVEERDELRQRVQELEAEKDSGGGDVETQLAALRAKMEQEKRDAVEEERKHIEEDLAEIEEEYKKLMEEAANKAAQDVWTKMEKGKR